MYFAEYMAVKNSSTGRFFPIILTISNPLSSFKLLIAFKTGCELSNIAQTILSRYLLSLLSTNMQEGII